MREQDFIYGSDELGMNLMPGGDEPIDEGDDGFTGSGNTDPDKEEK